MTTLSSRTTAIISILVANLIWGLAAPLVKIELQTIPPFSLLFLRSLFTSIILFPYFEFVLLPKDSKMTAKDKWTVFLAGTSGVFLNLAFYFWGQSLTSVIDAFVIISLGTPITLALSYIFLRERLQKVTYLGILLAFIGSIIVIGSPILTFGNGNFWGNLLVFGAATGASVSYLLISKISTKFNPMTLTYYFFLISTIFSFPFFIWEFIQNPFYLSNLSFLNMFILAYLVLGSSISSYALINFGLKHLPASLTSTLGYTSTIVAILAGVVLLKEHTNLYYVVGTTFVVLGLILAETRHKK